MMLHLQVVSAAAAALFGCGTGVEAHTDLALRPCDAEDPEQLWTLPAVAVAGNFVHASTQKCLMANGCNDDPTTILVLDDCTPTCLSQQKQAGTFILQNHGRIVSQMIKQLVVHSGPPRVALRKWQKTYDPGQQWTVGPASEPAGKGFTLQVGKSADGKGYLPLCPKDPCCLTTHYDVVPDGDGGWSLVAAIFGVILLYLCGGLYLGRKRGHRTHIHVEQSKQVWGLVRDGWAFALSRGRVRRATTTAVTSKAHGSRADGARITSKQIPDAAMTRPAALAHATRGTPGLLHFAASTGDTAKLELLLRQISRGRGDTGTLRHMRSGEQSSPAATAELAPELNRGDHRRYTPFVTACAGGHAACVSLLLDAGCDTSLLCDTGLTGWELAEELHRAEVLALRQVPVPESDAAAGGDNGSSDSTATSKCAKHSRGEESASPLASVRRSKRRDGKGLASTKAESVVPLLSSGEGRSVNTIIL